MDQDRPRDKANEEVYQRFPMKSRHRKMEKAKMILKKSDMKVKKE